MKRRAFIAIATIALMFATGGCSVWHELWADVGTAPTTARERRIERIERGLDEGGR